MRFFFTILLAMVCFYGYSQMPMPDALFKSPIQEQINALLDRTKVFDNYRAIREDMWQKFTANIADTVRTTNERIRNLSRNLELLKQKSDSLAAELGSTKSNLEEAIATKNDFRFFGKEIYKTTYSGIMWLAITGLAALSVILFLAFKKSIVVTHRTENELNELKEEFQAYKKSAREAREKMSMDHFNEIKRLRGG